MQLVLRTRKNPVDPVKVIAGRKIVIGHKGCACNRWANANVTSQNPCHIIRPEIAAEMQSCMLAKAGL